MLLINGRDVDVLGQVNIDNTDHLITKLPTATYIDGLLVNHIILPVKYFKEFRDKISAESAELLYTPDAPAAHTETLPESHIP